MNIQHEEFKRLVWEYASLQRALCCALSDEFDDPPKRGNLSFDEGYWEFEKHGLGFKFVLIPSEIVIDAHACWSSFPEGIDAWRIVTYLESKKIEFIEFSRNTYNACDERAVDRLLSQLVEANFLSRASCENHDFYLLK